MADTVLDDSIRGGEPNKSAAGWVRWCVPVVPATWEAVRRIA